MAQVKKRRAPPQAKFTTHADTGHIVRNVASLSADTDLLRIDGKPKFAPQRIVVVNLSTAAAPADAVLVFTPEKGADITLTVPQGMSVTWDHPVKTLVDSGSSGTFDVHCYWWDASTLDWNNEA